jgi:hypothetical protein
MRPIWDHSYGFLSDGHLICRSGGDTQGVASFVTAARLTNHHDERLADLTRQVNELFEKHREHEDGRALAFLATPEGIMLAWTRNEHHLRWGEGDGSADGVVNADSDEQTLRHHLGLR